MMMVIGIKQRQSNTWSSILKKIEAELKKSVVDTKKHVYTKYFLSA